MKTIYFLTLISMLKTAWGFHRSSVYLEIISRHEAGISYIEHEMVYLPFASISDRDEAIGEDSELDVKEFNGNHYYLFTDSPIAEEKSMGVQNYLELIEAGYLEYARGSRSWENVTALSGNPLGTKNFIKGAKIRVRIEEEIREINDENKNILSVKYDLITQRFSGYFSLLTEEKEKDISDNLKNCKNLQWQEINSLIGNHGIKEIRKNQINNNYGAVEVRVIDNQEKDTEEEMLTTEQIKSELGGVFFKVEDYWQRTSQSSRVLRQKLVIFAIKNPSGCEVVSRDLISVIIAE